MQKTISRFFNIRLLNENDERITLTDGENNIKVSQDAKKKMEHVIIGEIVMKAKKFCKDKKVR